ncbi:hypothetical protein GCM10027586_08540 [Kineococcus gypseus]|uniref:hypothetical protein n=1 Tax=Kineococcus gypseus TaxID=1637102 RepID=UPI003D7C855F
MEIDLRESARGVSAFAGGLLTVLLVPSEHSLQECIAVLQEQGVRAWTEHLPVPADLMVVTAGMPVEEAPSTDAIAEVRRHVLAVLEAAGIDVDVYGSGYLDATALSSH